MADFLLTVTLLVWIPLIPLRLAIQGAVELWRKIGEWYSPIFLIYWVLVDLVTFGSRDVLGSFRFESPLPLVIPGLLLILAAAGLAWWTSTTLGFTTLFLRPQLAPGKAKATLIIGGPYTYCRHPFYFMEWILLTGLFFVTGSWVILGILVTAIFIDPVVTILEEKELVERFGGEYRRYQKRVPRLVPWRIT